jgi:hypothetical protein
MKSTKAILLAVALLIVAFTAWAGEDAVVNKPRSARDKSVVAPTQKAADAEKPDQTPQPKEDAVQTPQAKTEADRASQPEPKAVHAPTSPQPWESWGVIPPVVRAEPGDKGELDRPPRGGQGGGRGGNGGRGNGGGHRHGGGYSWRGHHDEWRHRQYHGSWGFLFHFGPVIFPAPVYYPHVVRLPHDRVGVYVRHTGDDYVGTQFANSVREHLREEGLRVVYSPNDARIELYLVSMEQDPDESGYGSSVSVSYIWYPDHRFITAQIVDVGVDEVDDLALSVAGYADDQVNQYR